MWRDRGLGKPSFAQRRRAKQSTKRCAHEPSSQPSNLRRVEAPDAYWAQVINSAPTDDRLSFNQYRLVEHPYVEQWWDHPWELAAAIESDTGAVALVEFRLVD